MKKKLRRLPILFLLIIFVYFFLRLFNLENNVNFSDDQGKILLSVLDIWTNKKPVLIGPPTSFSFEGRYFYHGPITYYVLLPAMVLGNWNVLFGSYIVILVNFIALILIYLATKKIFGMTSGLIAASLFAVFPDAVYYTKFIWNPNFLPVVSSIILALIVGLGKFGLKLRMFLTGLFFGIGLQFHYQFILVILPVTIYLMFKNKEKLRTLSYIILGFAVGYSPVILFELRNSFYNTQTILFLIRNKVFMSESQPPSYYFLSLAPFIFFYLASIAFWIKGRVQPFTTVVAIFIILGSTFSSTLMLFNNRGMPKNWRYTDAEKVAKIISNENLNNYNVANLLSGDTRAYSLRYLLRISNSNPLGEMDYPNANNLFVLSYLDDKNTQNNSVWEISSFKGVIKKKWLIESNPDINLYLMTKSLTRY